MLELGVGGPRVHLDARAQVAAVVMGRQDLLTARGGQPCWRLLLRHLQGPRQTSPSTPFTGPSGPWWHEHLDPLGQLLATPIVASCRPTTGGWAWTSELVACNGVSVPIRSELTVECPTEGTAASFRLSVHNESDAYAVVGIELVPCGALRSSADDSLFMPFSGGERLRGAAERMRVVAHSAGDLQQGTPRVLQVQEGYLYSLPYAGSASMPWLYYEQGGAGLYLGQHDPDAGVVELRARCDGDALELGLLVPTWVLPDRVWQSPSLVLGGHRDGWHGAANRYRAWWDEGHPAPVSSAHWRGRSGLQITFLKTADGRIQQRFVDLPELLEELRPLGLDMLAPYGWSQGGFDSLNPDFYPDLELGGSAAMASAYHSIRSQGGEIMGYLNGRLFSERSPYHPALGVRCGAKQEDGTLNEESFGGQRFTTCCPGSPEWRDLIAGFGSMLAGDYGVRCIFLDQIAACPPLACHDESHGHGTPYAWNTVTRDLVRRVLEAVQAREPDAVLAVEGVSDVLVPYVLVQSYVGLYAVGHQDKFPELFAFTFPETVLADTVPYVYEPEGSMYSALGAFPLDLARHWTVRGIATGLWLGVMDQTRSDHIWWAEVTELLALRHAAAELLGNGRYRDTADVVAMSEGLHVTTTSTEAATLCVVRPVDEVKAGTFAIRWPHDTAFAGQLDARGHEHPVSARIEGGQLVLEVEASPLTLIVIRPSPDIPSHPV